MWIEWNGETDINGLPPGVDLDDLVFVRLVGENRDDALNERPEPARNLIWEHHGDDGDILEFMFLLGGTTASKEQRAEYEEKMRAGAEDFAAAINTIEQLIDEYVPGRAGTRNDAHRALERIKHFADTLEDKA